MTELMAGGSLRRHLGAPQLRYHARGRALLLQVAAALHHMHHIGLVHLVSEGEVGGGWVMQLLCTRS